MTSFASIRQPTRTAEVEVLSEERPLLRQNLDAMIVAIGHDQPPLGIELHRMRRAELAWPRSRSRR